MAVRDARNAGSISRYAAAGLCAILMAGCATSGQKAAKTTGEKVYREAAAGVFTNPESDPSSLDPIASAAFWGTRYNREPESAEMAARYAASLRKIGSVNEAVSVMSKAAERHPDDADVNLELGKALVENGRSFEAVRYFETALATRRDDWRALSAYGVALDQIGEHEIARSKYDAALLIAPEAASVMSNKGLSYALSGDLSKSVELLRAAATSRKGDARIRQNLALVLALKGDMGEAERLARSDLPPQIADRNIQFFRGLMNQPAYWQDFAADEAFETPDFEPAPGAPLGPAQPNRAPQDLPTLKEEPKKEEKRDPNAPVALGPATEATPASAEAEDDMAPMIKDE